MRTKAFIGSVAAIAATAAMLAGCAVAQVPSHPHSATAAAPTPSSSPSQTPSGAPSVATVDAAAYPLPANELSQGMRGVMFTAGGTGLQCAIFDPLAASDTFANPPEFGCEVSVDGYPYPPMSAGPMDTANGFISWSHQPATTTSITDSTYSGDTPAPPLPAGKSIAWSTVTCTAPAADEVRCVDATSGHGMRVSVRDYDLF